MTAFEASTILRAMYEWAPVGEKTVAVTLFGIQHGEVLRDLSVAEVVKAAGIDRSYGRHVRLGMKLKPLL